LLKPETEKGTKRRVIRVFVGAGQIILHLEGKVSQTGPQWGRGTIVNGKRGKKLQVSSLYQGTTVGRKELNKNAMGGTEGDGKKKNFYEKEKISGGSTAFGVLGGQTRPKRLGVEFGRKIR